MQYDYAKNRWGYFAMQGDNLVCHVSTDDGWMYSMFFTFFIISVNNG